MKKLIWLSLALALGAQAVLAGGPPNRGDRGGPPDRQRWDQFRGDFFGGRPRGNAFDAVRRYFDLTPEQQAALAKLDEQRSLDEREALVELAKTLDKKYAALIVEALPAEQKAKYEQVLAALAARDEAHEAAQKEFRAALARIREAQGVTGRMSIYNLPNSKTDIVRTCVNVTEDQRAAMDGVQRDAWAGMRDKMRDVVRPQNWGDAEARQKFGEAMRKVREQVETQAAEGMVILLNEEQKKAYQTGAAALDAYNKKVAEADDACEKKLIELVGAEKAKALRAGWWQQVPPIIQPGGPPGGPPPKGDEAAPRATEF